MTVNPSENAAQSSSRLARQLYTGFRQEWPTGNEQAHDLLDRLAILAQHNSVAYDLLLRAIQENRLTHPAIRKVLLNDDSIEEAVQSTLALVALKLHLFEGRSRFSTWLYRVASNEAKRVVRSEARTRKIDDISLQPSYLQRLSSLIADREVIFATIDRIDPIYRQPLQLREVEGLSYDEISNILGLPVGTVRSRLNRARRLVALELQTLGT